MRFTKEQENFVDKLTYTVKTMDKIYLYSAVGIIIGLFFPKLLFIGFGFLCIGLFYMFKTESILKQIEKIDVKFEEGE